MRGFFPLCLSVSLEDTTKQGEKKKEKTMNKEMKNDLIVVLNEIKEAKRLINLKLRTLRGGDLLEATDRIEKAKHWLYKYVDDSDVLEDLI